MTLEKVIASYEKGLEKLSREAESRAKKLIQPLLNSLQKRIKDRLIINYCNGDVWLADKDNRSGRYTDMSDVMISSGFKFHGYQPNRREERYMYFFPELKQMGEIIAAIEALRSCGFPQVIPTVNPRKRSQRKH